MTELKPCPFCGSKARKQIEGEPGSENEWIQCTSCMACANTDVWNHRKGEDKQDKRTFREKLREDN